MSIKAHVSGAGKRARKPEPRPRLRPRPRRRSLQDWPVSSRLVAVILLALGIGLIFGGLRVADAVGVANQFGRVTQLARLGEQGTTLVQDLQNERDETAAVIGGASPATLKQPYGATNTAVARFTGDATAVGGGFPANIRSGAATALTDAENVAAVRNLARANGNPTTVITDYTDPIQDTISLTGLIAQGVSDSVLSNDVRTLVSLSQVKEEATEQRALLFNALTQGFYSTGVELALNTAASQQRLDQVAYQSTATPAQQAALASAFSSAQANSAANIQDFMVSDTDPFTDIVNLGIGQTQSPATWYSLMSDEINQMQSVEQGIGQNIVGRAESLQDGAQRSAIITGVVTLAVLLLVLFATFIVARSLVQPLRRLRAGALDIASVQLPERVRLLSESPDSAAAMEVAPINVVSEDEIGQVARAFDQVHAEAVRLAGEQALLRTSFNATFVNLSRRLQSLIERLARMIDALEQTEVDGDRLGSLFSMDHLVTRMRRSSENLLLMAGHESPSRRSEPIPLADVVRAANSEIEQYNRVTLNIPPGVSVVGRAAPDVAHLLAELIENATLFSPDETKVHVSTQELSSGGVLIEIIDRGIGVSEARLTDMNSRLDNPPTMDVSVSRHMGLFAVARLAERHRIRVRLRPAPPRGLSALVWLPESVIERTGRYYSVQGRSPQSASVQTVGAARRLGASVAIDEGTAALAQSGYGDYRDYRDSGDYGGNAGGAPSETETRSVSGWFRRPAAADDPAPDQTVHHITHESPADPYFSGQTSAAGLPIRRSDPSRPTPGRGAVPGGSGGRGHALPPRSPDEARSSLAAFQRGTRRAEEQSGQSGQFGQVLGAGERSER